VLLREMKTRQRVIDHGEVFTPDWMVEAMLGQVGDECERIDSRFLEPACGSGNFLAPILQRKLAAVEKRFGTNEFERTQQSLLALMCTYGIELLEDNVDECRQRLLSILGEYLQLDVGDVVLAAAARVLEANVVRGDALTMSTAGGVPRPITFSEWAYLGMGRFNRRDFRFDILTQMSDFGEETLFGDVSTHDIFTAVKDYQPLSIAEIAYG
jgi:hypothetical protein